MLTVVRFKSFLGEIRYFIWHFEKGSNANQLILHALSKCQSFPNDLYWKNFLYVIHQLQAFFIMVVVKNTTVQYREQAHFFKKWPCTVFFYFRHLQLNVDFKRRQRRLHVCIYSIKISIKFSAIVFLCLFCMKNGLWI